MDRERHLRSASGLSPNQAADLLDGVEVMVAIGADVVSGVGERLQRMQDELTALREDMAELRDEVVRARRRVAAGIA